MSPGSSEEVDERQLEAVVDMGLQIIYGSKDSPGGEANPAVLEMLRDDASGDPIQTLATIAGTIGGRVAQEIAKSGNPVDGAAVFMGTMEFVGELADVAKTEGLYDYSEQEVNSATVRAGEVLFNATEGLGIWDQAEMEQDLSQLVQDDSDGSLKAQVDVMARQTPQRGEIVKNGR